MTLVLGKFMDKAVEEPHAAGMAAADRASANGMPAGNVAGAAGGLANGAKNEVMPDGKTAGAAGAPW